MTDHKREGLLDKITGRFKKAAGDLKGDEKLRREGAEEESRGEAKEELDAAHEEVERKTREVERRS